MSILLCFALQLHTISKIHILSVVFYSLFYVFAQHKLNSKLLFQCTHTHTHTHTHMMPLQSPQPRPVSLCHSSSFNISPSKHFFCRIMNLFLQIMFFCFPALTCAMYRQSMARSAVPSQPSQPRPYSLSQPPGKKYSGQI